MRSMTGFGRGEVSAANAQIVVEIKSVNHRFLEVRTRTPAELNSFEPVLDKCVRQRLSRGYCNVHLTVENPENGIAAIASDRLAFYVDQLQRVAEKMNVSAESLMSVLTNAPDLYRLQVAAVTDELRDGVISACNQALDRLIAMRENEGTHMRQDVEERMVAISQLTRQISEEADEQAQAVLEKYSRRITELLAGHGSDELRIETEAAIHAEKADVNEEINRLFSHIKQMDAVFTETVPVGRRMDFLVQEMGREANTIASKSIRASVTHKVVSIKGELEKIRELIQNIE